MLPSQGSRPFFMGAVPVATIRVLLIRGRIAEIDMRRIYARRIVAMMANQSTGRDRPVGETPGESVSVYLMRSIMKHTVTKRVPAALPFPAFTRIAALDLRPESHRRVSSRMRSRETGAATRAVFPLPSMANERLATVTADRGSCESLLHAAIRSGRFFAMKSASSETSRTTSARIPS